MAESQAANIGANFSNYQGNAGLGGFGLGAGRIDTGPLMDLAKYAMLYNREEHLQRQKAKEKAAEELVKYTSLDLSTTIPKDAKILQDKFDELHNYIKTNPEALDYNNRDKWLEYNKKKADLINDIKFAKLRSVINVSRKEAISLETNEQKKKLLEQELQKNINDTDIRTPLDFEQKYDIKLPEFGTNKGVSVDVTKAGSNQIFQRGFNLFDIKEAQRAAANFELGIEGIDPATKTGQFKLLDVNENFWIKGTQLLNQAIAGAKDANGNVDTSKLAGIPIMNNIKAYNEYVGRIKSAIKTGSFTDQFGNKLQFASIPFGASDYQEINLNDGISPSELGVVAQFSQWAGDQYETKVIQTDDEIQRANIATEWERIGVARAQLNKSSNEDLISATSVIREAADVLNSGMPRTLTWNGGKRDINIISDPNLLREFGTIDKDGNVTNVPDNVYYDKDANKLSLIYYKRELVDEDDVKKGSQIVEGKKGERVIDRSVDISPTQWFGQIVKRKNPNKDIGGVNALIEQFYNAPEIGRRLDNLSKIYSQNVQGSAGTSESERSSTTTPGKTIKGKSGKTIFIPE